MPPSKTQFAWATEQRANAKTYFHTKLDEWDTLGTTRAKIEAAEAAAALADAANPDATVDAKIRSMLTPTPTRRMVRPPAHLVFRTKIVTRTPKSK
ncbi:MAG TPA: hypothetical protein VM867_06230 [Xanthobacteraceae bacterium]|nr:hypothetical protein [Xanthobacteraceae bacterium]